MNELRSNTLCRSRFRQGAGIGIGIVMALVTIIFLGAAATSYFRRGVTRQLETLVHNRDLVMIGEAAIGEVAQMAKIEEFLAVPANLDRLVQAFREGEYKGGLLLPKPVEMWIPPEGTRARFAEDERITIGDVRIFCTQYRPRPRKNWGVFRFLVEVQIKQGERVFRRRIAHDYMFTMLDPDRDRKLTILMPKAPAAKVYP